MAAQRPRHEERGEVKPKAVKPRPSIEEKADSFWVKMDALFDRTLRKAEQAHMINTSINIVTVGIGVALLATSIALSWVQQASPFTVAFAVIGVADFVAVFLIGPQRGIAASLGDLNQIQMAYRMFAFEFEALIDYNWEKYEQGNRSIEEISAMNREAERVMTTTIDAIEKYIGRIGEKEKDKEREASGTTSLPGG